MQVQSRTNMLNQEQSEKYKFNQELETLNQEHDNTLNQEKSKIVQVQSRTRNSQPREKQNNASSIKN